MQFTQGLHRAIQLHPDAIATICEDRKLTFTQLADRVSRIAGGFAAQGISAGQTVAMLGLNSDYYLQYYLACAWSGVIANPVNFRWSSEEIIYSLNDSEAVGIILDDRFAPMAAEIKAACPTLQHLYYAGENAEQFPELAPLESLITESEPVADGNYGDNSLFGVFYTGGTTGFPKGVMLSHDNLCTAPFGFLAEGGFPDGCIGLHVAPMFHLADMMQTMSLLLRGCTHVMQAVFTPENVLTDITKHNVTDLLIVPTMLQMMIDHPDFGDYDTSSLQRVYYGGSPFAEAALDRALAALPNAKFMQGYGMTESSAIITVLPWDQHYPENRHKGHTRSGGRPALHTQLRIVDENEAPLAAGEVGEIIFRSPGVMQGYLNKPEATEEALRNGWMHTGDVGYINDEGYVFVIDRSKDMIISGGENVYCTEVENAISKHPSVTTSAVFGIPSEEWGEAVHAAVVLKPGSALTIEELTAHCKQQIAGYKCPRSMDIVEALPMTGAGKVKKNELRDPYWKR
ncbi:MAG: long-chain fatty acid--CoA ligase [Porticoccaceae bacterium]|nr:long-chain fatty acid--CoA ligase [Pseudomonadales bacterium]MCP5172367.1 long-chain fatty acid--CoA ligase [Pseudomonadales bacterium]